MASKIDNVTNLPDLDKIKKLSEEEISHYVNRYINEVISGDAYAPAKLNNILGFFELVQNAIRSRENSQDVPKGKKLLVLAHDPPEEVDTEAITFHLSAREPGQFNRGPAGNSRVKEVVAHYRNSIQHPEHIGEKLITMGRLFDNYITFNIYARDDFTALKRVLWLEDVMESFRWYFRVHGIKEIIEMGVGEKQKVKVGELELTKYPMSYFVRTEDTYQFGSQELKFIELNVDVSTD